MWNDNQTSYSLPKTEFIAAAVIIHSIYRCNVQLNEVRLNKVVKVEAKPDTLSCQFERARERRRKGGKEEKKREITPAMHADARVYMRAHKASQ